MLTTPAQVKQEGNLPASIDDTVLATHIVKAVIEMKKILTEDKYKYIADLDEEDDAYLACSLAEANLALFYAIPALNIETAGTGIVRSKGWDQSRSDLLTQGEVDRLIERYRNTAMNLLGPYIPQVESTEDNPADEVKGSNWYIAAL